MTIQGKAPQVTEAMLLRAPFAAPGHLMTSRIEAKVAKAIAARTRAEGHRQGVPDMTVYGNVERRRLRIRARILDLLQGRSWAKSIMWDKCSQPNRAEWEEILAELQAEGLIVVSEGAGVTLSLAGGVRA